MGHANVQHKNGERHGQAGALPSGFAKCVRGVADLGDGSDCLGSSEEGADDSATRQPAQSRRRSSVAALSMLVLNPLILILLTASLDSKLTLFETKEDRQKLQWGKRKGESMDLRELIGRIIGSSREDWHLIADAPSYRDHLQFYEMYEGQPNVLHVAAHPSVAVYIPDVSITMAWGLKWLEDFKEDWCKNFPDSKAHGGFVDVFFDNSLVYRTAYVWVDGIHFPLPRHTEAEALEVDEGACAFMRLIDSMGRAARPPYDAYESDLRRAGFTVVDDEWPKFLH